MSSASVPRLALLLAATVVTSGALAAQAAHAPQYTPTPSFDLSSIDPAADPCKDFYAFACGRFAAQHPIPADQASTNSFSNLDNVNSEELAAILDHAQGSADPKQRKIGDYFHACMDTAAIERRGLEPVAPLLARIDRMGLLDLPGLTGDLQRMGVTALFSYGPQQDFKDASKVIAFIDQGGIGLPERDFYLRAGAKDEEIRKAYIAYITKLLTLSGTKPAQAAKDAAGVMTFETALARASMGVVERREPEKTYHLVPIASVSKQFPLGLWSRYEAAVRAPHITEINDASPAFVPGLIAAVRSTDIAVLRAYLRFHVLSDTSSQLPRAYDDASFDFYGRVLRGATEQRARWKRCSNQVDYGLGEMLGQVYVERYFAGDAKTKTLQMVGDIEAAMGRDIDSLDWMSAPTKLRAHEKLAGMANKIGYPAHWRDYSTLEVKPDDPVGNLERANAFESDRQLAKIGKPVDREEFGMTPPTVNAYYNPSMNDINFPAGILQPNFYDPKVDDAVNYGHIGGVIGHELTHGFDDEGKKFDGHGNLSDWWTAEDTKKFEARTGCLVDEYNKFTAVDDVHVNGKLTLGENTADNGGLLLAYMAYLDRANKNGEDMAAKRDGYTGPQRFYIAWAQDWCSNDRPESLRTAATTDPHAPTALRANGPLVNQPGFAGAFSCKAGSPMVPAKSCRVW